MAAPDIRAWTGTEKSSHEDELVVDEIEKEQTKFTLYYDAARRRVTKLCVLQTLPGGATISFTAGRAEPVHDGWLLYDVKGEGPAVRERIWRTSLKPRDLETALLPLDVRPLSVLHHEIKHPGTADAQRMASLRLFYAARLTYPFTGLVLIALGMPFVIGHEKIQRSRMLGIGICVVICIIFYTVQTSRGTSASTAAFRRRSPPGCPSSSSARSACIFWKRCMTDRVQHGDAGRSNRVLFSLSMTDFSVVSVLRSPR